MQKFEFISQLSVLVITSGEENKSLDKEYVLSGYAEIRPYPQQTTLEKCLIFYLNNIDIELLNEMIGQFFVVMPWLTG